MEIYDLAIIALKRGRPKKFENRLEVQSVFAAVAEGLCRIVAFKDHFCTVVDHGYTLGVELTMIGQAYRAPDSEYPVPMEREAEVTSEVYPADTEIREEA